MALDLDRMINRDGQHYSIAEIIESSTDCLQLDVTFLHELPENGLDIGLTGDDLAEFVRRCIAAHLDAGAIVVTQVSGKPWEFERLPQFGTERQEIIDNLILYWQQMVKTAGEKAFNWDFLVALGTISEGNLKPL